MSSARKVLTKMKSGDKKDAFRGRHLERTIIFILLCRVIFNLRFSVHFPRTLNENANETQFKHSSTSRGEYCIIILKFFSPPIRASVFRLIKLHYYGVIARQCNASHFILFTMLYILSISPRARRKEIVCALTPRRFN